MLKLCALLPINYLHWGNNLNDYHLILPHIAEKSKLYLNHFKYQKGYKIIDNSTFELGHSVSNKLMYQIIKEINANAYFLPEIKNDEKESIKIRNQFLKSEIYNNLYDKLTYQAFQSEDAIPIGDYISIPAHLNRPKVIDQLFQKYGHIFNSIYLSGLTGGKRKFDITKIAELIYLQKKYPNLNIYMDTSLPYLLTKINTSLNRLILTGDRPKLPKMDFWDFNLYDFKLFQYNFWNLKSLTHINDKISKIKI